MNDDQGRKTRMILWMGFRQAGQPFPDFWTVLPHSKHNHMWPHGSKTQFILASLHKTHSLGIPSTTCKK